MEQVVRGLYPYERDSVLFDHIEYSWPLLSGLLWSAGIHGQLNLIDFGGSLGSTYQQNRKFLSSVPHEWHIVEQPAFVSLGRAKYQTNQLRFYGSIEECLQSRKVNTLLISSTLQYLPDPVGFLRQTLTNQFPVVILDRLSIVPGLDGLRLTKQSVSDKIYSASYPCWFFSEDIILDEFKKDYELVERFEAHPLNECFIDGRTRAVDYGYIFRRRNS
jgi:putative methyltransferase (TIGR04325 family)